MIAKFIELPLGTRFRYLPDDGKNVFVKLGMGDDSLGLIAQWQGVRLNFVTQGIYTFADSVHECKTREVLIVGEPDENRSDMDPVNWVARNG